MAKMGRLAWLGWFSEGCINFFLVFGSFFVAKLSSGIQGSVMRRIYCRIAHVFILKFDVTECGYYG